MGPRIQQYVERMMRSRNEIFDEAGRKRVLGEQAGYTDAKRQRIGAPVQQLEIRPLAPGPQSLATVFTLTSNPGLQAFDAAQIPAALAARVSVKALAAIPQEMLDRALNVGC